MGEIPLTNSLKVKDGSHILYSYQADEAYVENAASFIIAGLKLDQHIVFIDREERYKRVLAKLNEDMVVDKLHFINNQDFYATYQSFDYDAVLSNMEAVVDPYVLGKTVVRLWGHVEFLEENHVYDELAAYEHAADCAVHGLRFTTVCVYDGRRIPAAFLTELLKCHEYYMTDSQLVRSNLYINLHPDTPAAVFPSISVQQNIESEMDLYKQKLDFVHVVSHEVRNPLTVIRAYATLLAETEEDWERKAKLQTIINYATVIDYEITHIINTEEMLTTDAVWQKSVIQIRSAVNEAVNMMRVKAITQNIELVSEFALDGSEVMLANSTGLKLILTNLLSNAIKYSLEGNRVFFNVHRMANSIAVTVADEGIGMTEEQQSKLFLKYEKMNTDKSGQGIGLFMVKKLVDHFDGTLLVQSEPGRGSSFFVTLPLCVMSDGHLEAGPEPLTSMT